MDILPYGSIYSFFSLLWLGPLPKIELYHSLRCKQSNFLLKFKLIFFPILISSCLTKTLSNRPRRRFLVQRREEPAVWIGQSKREGGMMCTSKGSGPPYWTFTSLWDISSHQIFTSFLFELSYLFGTLCLW